MAREITSLSLAVRNGKRRNDGAVCSGAGSGEACITLVRPPGSMKVISSIPADFVFHADAAVELDQVGADAEENVLAVVDDFAGAGMLVGRSASAEVGAALEESDAKAGVGESAGGGESGEAASGDGYGGLGDSGSCGIRARVNCCLRLTILDRCSESLPAPPFSHRSTIIDPRFLGIR